MNNKAVKVILTMQQYKQWKEFTLELKNINIFGKTYKDVSDDELGGLLGAILQQPQVLKAMNDTRDAIRDLKGGKKDGNKQ